MAGHAAHGNLHFLLAFDAALPADVARYAAFMDAFCRLTVERFDGSLKAEHSTGRNMAPFLELEWGPEATELMWRTKRIIDPDLVLAPRVLLDRDPRAHLRGLKTIPRVEAVADPCIECGFCEPTCPSEDVTTTPRQRIVLRREMMRQPPGSPVLEGLLDAYGYDAVDTCAGDSTCKLACPVGIDTGALMKDFRHRRHGPREERVAELAARRFRTVESAARLAVAAADTISQRGGDRFLRAVTGAARKVVSPDLVPEWLRGSRRSGPRTARHPAGGGRRGVLPGLRQPDLRRPRGRARALLPEAVVALSERAGLPVWIPRDVAAPVARRSGTPRATTPGTG